ncbi:electron transport complex subunit RsxC [Alkalibacterium olivapovliticus]|uniref:Ion-translocating oxidoreductase complex subunit C n=1 Tax=Alkalibacterium olivapovliticus TaxID=99907 RepID=A0A2T0W9X6_9LACT|nr:electron transport complex subunit RsxC [Alkalibacterium olivapovliticus]PRY83519.1 electron transport complex protein RnfC [Alkalibacterium olivapovliticus]
MSFSFMGKHNGSHPEENKSRTSKLPIVDASVPKIMIFPVSMHIGAPAKPIVEVGDQVKVGQILAEEGGFVSAHVYSSVSGEVIAIEKRGVIGGEADSIIVKNDYKYLKADPIVEPGRSQDMSKDEIISTVRKAGIVGMGGATFPTAVKLSPPPGMTIDTLIINGAECEPYSTSDHRVMVEHADEIISGINLSRTLFPMLRRIYIGIEDNKPDAIKALEDASADFDDIFVRPLKTMYPQGSEKNLIKNLAGREVSPGGLPAEVRCVVANTSTIRSCYRACEFGEPLIERIVSVSGTPIKEPKNLRVKIGTPMDSLIEDCGGFAEVPGKVLGGGPMMGKPVSDLGVPIIKGTTAITVLNPEEAEIGDEQDCIMCSECINVCPVSLQPILISEAFERGNIDKAKELGAMDCIECGNCSFICPSKIPLLDNIRSAKAAIKQKEEK